MLSIGLYIPLWFGATWRELREETKDAEMQPGPHALSILVPGYGAWQAFRHFALIDRLLAKVGSPMRVDPVTAALGITVWWITWLHYSNDPVFVALNVIELAAGTAVVVLGQRALNEVWRARPGGAGDERLRPSDWFALGLAATVFVYVVASILTPPTN